MVDLLGGQVHLMFDAMPSSLQHIKSGRLRALAVTTTSRSEALPDVPSVSEFLPGYNEWLGGLWCT
jgi:tripartite-type tricarboxylate transporter receptor subunit TctC